jgi:N-formylglutamate amidohydrolase
VKQNEQMQIVIRKKTDWFTDELFMTLVKPGSCGIDDKCLVFPYSRSYCDVERLIDDPLKSQGQGIIYDFGLEISQEDIFRRLYLYNQYRDKLARMIVNGTLLLDCHSFSIDSEYDVCLGFNEDDTKPDGIILKVVEEYFKKHGLRVGINTPYSNSITVETNCMYQSLMIELNQKLYLNPETKEKTDGFQELSWIIQGLYRRLKGDIEASGNESVKVVGHREEKYIYNIK